ncbi:MAG: ABC transporter permease, partial [Terriglobales bacterium]
MRAWRELIYRLRCVFRRGAVERELAEELAALRPAEFDATAEACRDQRGIGWLETTARDLRFGWRGLWRSPGFTITAVLTLAIGIGAATAIYSMAIRVLLHPVGYPHPEQLVQMQELVPAIAGRQSIASPASDIPAMRAHAEPFSGLAAFLGQLMTLSGHGTPDRIEVDRVSSNLLPVLQAQPMLGRDFRPDEEAAGHNRVILSAKLWHQHFDGRAGALGQVLDLDGQPFTVIGVMPAGFEFPPRGLPGYETADAWIPLALTQDERTRRADGFDFGVLARLKPEATLAQAQSAMSGAGRQIWQEWGAPKNDQVRVVASQLVADMTRPVATLMDLLLGAAGLLLVLGCANVANLLLARGSTRRHELALRVSLGAGRKRIVRHLLTESVVLGGVAGAM